ncbi:hypothetical protein D3C71_1393440 [compost metagenome]
MNTLEDIAVSLMTGRVTENIFEGWELRKGKTTEDINKALKKGVKAGDFKTEREIEWVALYLQDVLKKKKSNKQGNS